MSETKLWKYWLLNRTQTQTWSFGFLFFGVAFTVFTTYKLPCILHPNHPLSIAIVTDGDMEVESFGGINALPPELHLLILEHVLADFDAVPLGDLPTRRKSQRPCKHSWSALCSLSKVSKYFRSITLPLLLRRPWLSKTMQWVQLMGYLDHNSDMAPFVKSVSLNFTKDMMTWMNVGAYHKCHCRLRWFADCRGLFNLLDRFPNLSQLAFSGRLLTELASHIGHDPACKPFLIMPNERLQSIAVKHNLRHLNTTELWTQFCAFITTWAPKVASLRIDGLWCRRRARRGDRSDEKLAGWPSLTGFNSLRSLVLTSNVPTTDNIHSVGFIKTLLRFSTHLETVRVKIGTGKDEDADGVKGADIVSALSPCKETLVDLSIDFHRNMRCFDELVLIEDDSLLGDPFLAALSEFRVLKSLSLNDDLFYMHDLITLDTILRARTTWLKDMIPVSLETLSINFVIQPDDYADIWKLADAMSEKKFPHLSKIFITLSFLDFGETIAWRRDFEGIWGGDDGFGFYCMSILKEPGEGYDLDWESDLDEIFD